MIYTLSRFKCSIPIINRLFYNRLFYKQQISRMSRFIVRTLPTEERMDMSLDYSYNGQFMRTYNMNRLKTEELRQSLARLKLSILSKVKKKKKRKAPEQDVEEVDLVIKLTINNQQVLDGVPNIDAFVQGAILHIEETQIEVVVNPPTVKSLSLPGSIMAGFPVFPNFEAEFCNLNDSSFKWFRLPVDKELSQDVMYTPTSDDIDHYLRLVFIPKENERCGIECEVLSENKVSAGPGQCPFEKRQLCTPEIKEKDRFRVMTYNILADLYADSDYSREELFPHCPPYALHIDYRKQLLLKEIKGYNADIICLQEVDKKIFENYFLGPFQALGYEGDFKQKGAASEGEAIFFRSSKFRLIKEYSMTISEVMANDPLYADVLEKVKTNETLFEFVMKRTSILQVLILESVDDPSKKLLVGNTHFYFHPKSGTVRLIHAIVCVRHLEHLVQQYISEGNTLSVIYCGDFNSTPQRGVNQFVTTGYIGADAEDWTYNEEMKLSDMEFSHSLKMISACGYPEYTNYVGYFNGTLDYIFVDTDNIEVTSVIANPTHDEVVLYKALPSVVFPSDHIAQICDLKWKSSS